MSNKKGGMVGGPAEQADHGTHGAFHGEPDVRIPPHETGPSTRPAKPSGDPSGSGWLVARVRVARSTITIGPQSDTAHSRPASRSQWACASLNHSAARC
jgi:hypothetical protein